MKFRIIKECEYGDTWYWVEPQSIIVRSFCNFFYSLVRSNKLMSVHLSLKDAKQHIKDYNAGKFKRKKNIVGRNLE